MLVRLHSQATTTPKVRAEIQASDEAAWILAERHGTTEQTVYSGVTATALKIAATHRIAYRQH